MERATLVRFVAWAFARGQDEPTTLGMALALNREWPSPLSPADVLLVVRRVGRADEPRRYRRNGRPA